MVGDTWGFARIWSLDDPGEPDHLSDFATPHSLTSKTEPFFSAHNPDVLRAWQDLGLPSGQGEELEAQDIDRVRLLRFRQSRGFGPEAVARACQTQGDLLGAFVDSSLGGGFLPADRRARHSLTEAPEAAGLDPAVLRRLWTAAGLGDQDEAYDDDVAALRALRAALDAGLPEQPFSRSSASSPTHSAAWPTRRRGCSITMCTSACAPMGSPGRNSWWRPRRSASRS